jgi:hypothetical protein
VNFGWLEISAGIGVQALRPYLHLVKPNRLGFIAGEEVAKGCQRTHTVRRTIKMTNDRGSIAVILVVIKKVSSSLY